MQKDGLSGAGGDTRKVVSILWRFWQVLREQQSRTYSRISVSCIYGVDGIL